LFAQLSITLKHSLAYYSEINGQIEKINAILEQYLRAYINFRQNNWVDWLPLAEFALNNAVSEITGFSPFFANYGFMLRAGSRRQASLRKTDAVGVRENLSSGPAKPGKPLKEWIRIHFSRLFPSRSTRPCSCFSFFFY
jgi:hypothetical protein